MRRIREVLREMLLLAFIMTLAVPVFLAAADTTAAPAQQLKDKIAELVVAAISLLIGYIVVLFRSFMTAKIQSIKDPVLREKAEQAVLYAADIAGKKGAERLDIAANWLTQATGVSKEKAITLVRPAYQKILNDPAFPLITNTENKGGA